jgi:hypothetical protein
MERTPFGLELAIDPKEVVICYLEHERERWLPARAKAERAGGWNSEANKAAADRMERIDYLLEELWALIAPEVVTVEAV